MHPSPPSSIHPNQLHPAPSSPIHLHPAHFSFHLALQHLRQYLNQNIARNWAISPNLDRKIKSCSFWKIIGTHDILEVLIPNRELDFWNSDPKIHFWTNLDRKIQSCPFCLKIGTHSISRMLITNPDLDFWKFDPKIHFWANLGPKIQSCPFWKLVHIVSQGCWFRIQTLKSLPQNPVLGKFGPKHSKLSILFANWYT